MTVAKAEIRPYDPSSQRRVMQEHLYGLDLINQSFARHFRMAFVNFMRRGADVIPGTLTYQSYQDFAQETPGLASLNLVDVKPLHGMALMVFPADLVDRVVDSLFGGSGDIKHTTDRREFTVTEQRIARRVLNLALDAYSEAWRVVSPVTLTYVRTEIQAKFANITNAQNETVVTSTFKVEVAGAQSEFKVCLPYAAIEPLREVLANSAPRQRRARDAAWQQRVSSRLRGAPIELIAELTTIESTVGAVEAMRPGDVLPMEMPETVTANVAGVPVLTCTYGTHGKHLALQVQRRITQSFTADLAWAQGLPSQAHPASAPAAEPTNGDEQ